jgi:hypothetical protein
MTIMYCCDCHCCQQLLFILFVITYVQGIYNYIPQTDHISRVNIVAAVLYSQFVVHVVVVVVMVVVVVVMMMMMFLLLLLLLF